MVTNMIRNKNSNPTRIIYMTIVFIFAFSLCGCGLLSTIDEGLKENKRKSDDKYWTERNVPPVELDLDVSCVGKESSFNADIRVSRCVYKYLEDGDINMLTKMFAKSVRKEYGELENDIDDLIEFYSGLEVDGYEVESNSRYKVHRIDPEETIIEYTYHTNFVSNKERYVLDILFVSESNRDEKLLGVHGIKLRNRDTNKSVIVNTIDRDI